MTADELEQIKFRVRLSTVPIVHDTIGEVSAKHVVTRDAPALIAEIERQAAELRAWREWVRDEFGARLDPDDPDVPNTDETLRSLASAINNEW